MYELVSKSDHPSGMTVQERRHDLVRKVDDDTGKPKSLFQTEAQKLLSISEKSQETSEPTDPSARYHIGMSQKSYTSISTLIASEDKDPALKVSNRLIVTYLYI
jgi:hypothetical protein